MNEEDMAQRISDLADGQLGSHVLADTIEQLARDPVQRRRWQTYHLLGEVLRTGQHAPCSDGEQFVARLRQRLEAPPRSTAQAAFQGLDLVATRPASANDPVFRWKALAGVAVLAMTAAIAWGVMRPVPAPQLALANDSSAPLLLARSGRDGAAANAGLANTQVMLRDARLDQLLAAHQQADAGTQMPAGFLRNATFEPPAR